MVRTFIALVSFNPVDRLKHLKLYSLIVTITGEEKRSGNWPTEENAK
jgi:hypothetical protein